MNGLVLGLDIGIGSVGVGILKKDTGEIIHTNSRIFPAATADNNVERRNSRQGRRLNRRKKHRVVRFQDLFDDYGLLTDFSKVPINLNPYRLRVHGLNQQLTNEELFIALKNIVKRRGISYLDDASEDGGAVSSDYGSKAVEENRKLLAEQTPGQIQLERFEKYGQVRGDFTVEEKGDKHRLINVFSTSAYRKEAERILRKQQEFNNQITDKFIEDYLKILTEKRKYYHGPGNEKSRTDYGRFRTDGTTLDNIFGILIGKCTFYPNEYRASKASYTAQEFNLLNDLNNLTVPTETKKLSEEQKKTIVEYAKSAKTLGTSTLLKYIAKMIDASVDQIRGYRVDVNNKPEMHTFEVYRKMQSLETIPVGEFSREVLDELAHILTLNTEREGIEEAINTKLMDVFSQDQILELVQFRKNNSSLFSKGWHNFSLKLMMELIPELYETSEEQMAILTRLGKQKFKETSKRTKYIDEQEVTEEIYNPVVAKSVRQAIKIINEATKKYGIFDDIVIEMARENNEEDAKKDYIKRQKANHDEKNAAMEKAAFQYNGKKELPDSIFHGHKELATKIRLWHQQGEKCLYTGKNIPISDLIHNQYKYEIDHILPLSLSFDDSLSNKVLVLATANQEKGQRTPFQALDSMDDAWSYREFKSYVKDSKLLGNKKKDYLLTEEDISKIEVKQKFIERNLVDTRYSSRVVLNTLQDFYKAHKFDTTISVVRGQFTSQLRRKWGLGKSRETYHHHAVDALIIAASSQLRLWKKQANPLISYKEDQFVDSETGEIISLTDDQYKELVFKAPYAHFVDTLSSKKFEDSILFSYQVDSKYNRKISDATIYATRKVKLDKDKSEETYVLGKIKDIYSQAGYDAFIKIYNKDKSKFLMYHKDPQTFEKVIEEILRNYPSKEFNEKNKEVPCNPFEKYRQENGPIRKYSKKGNGPEIKSLKYYDKNIPESFINITPSNSKNRVILRQLNPWRTDVYFNHQKEKYELLGLKYADLQFEKKTGTYSITIDKYNEIKEKEGVGEQSEFKFTLYKNDLLLIKDTKNNEKQIFRFLSRTMPNQKHYVELKPYYKGNFEGKERIKVFNTTSNGRCLKGLGKKGLSIYKIKTDVLGNKHFIKKEGEKPKLKF